MFHNIYFASQENTFTLPIRQIHTYIYIDIYGFLHFSDRIVDGTRIYHSIFLFLSLFTFRIVTFFLCNHENSSDVEFLLLPPSKNERCPSPAPLQSPNRSKEQKMPESFLSFLHNMYTVRVGVCVCVYFLCFVLCSVLILMKMVSSCFARYTDNDDDNDKL